MYYEAYVFSVFIMPFEFCTVAFKEQLMALSYAKFVPFYQKSCK